MFNVKKKIGINYLKIVSMILVTTFLMSTLSVLAANVPASRTIKIRSIESLVGNEVAKDAFMVTRGTKSFSAVVGFSVTAGDVIETKTGVTAYFEIDNKIVVEMFQNTKIEIQKTKSNELEMKLISGEIFFDTNGSLKETESLEFSAGGMVMGVRGTSGTILVSENGEASSSLYTGHVEIFDENDNSENREPLYDLTPGYRITHDGDAFVDEPVQNTIDSMSGYEIIVLSKMLDEFIEFDDFTAATIEKTTVVREVLNSIFESSDMPTLEFSTLNPDVPNTIDQPIMANLDIENDITAVDEDQNIVQATNPVEEVLTSLTEKIEITTLEIVEQIEEEVRIYEEEVAQELQELMEQELLEPEIQDEDLVVTTPMPTLEPSASPEPSDSPDPSVSPEPTISPEPSVSPDPSVSPEPTISPEPSVSPEPTVSPEPSVSPDPVCSGCGNDHSECIELTSAGGNLPAGDYYLKQDTQITSKLIIENGEVNLCLNGFELSSTSTYMDNIIFINGGTLNLYDGTGSNTGSIARNINSEASSLIYINAGTFNMYGGKLTGNKASNGGAVYQNSGTFNLHKGEISDNKATNNGGAVYISTGTLNLYQDSVIKNNTANDGGAIYMYGGTCNMSGGMISDNNTTGGSHGGGIYLNGSNAKFNMTGGAISDNIAGADGGGIYINGGAEFIMGEGSTITNNKANGSQGGGLYVNGSGSTLTITGGTITGNVAVLEGGGIYINQGNVDMSGGEITNNTASSNGGGVYAPTTFTSSSASSGLSVSGTANITQNKGQNTKVDNVYLPSSAKITISDSLEDEAIIGVTMVSTIGGEFATVTDSNIEAKAENFSSDDTTKTVTVDSTTFPKVFKIA